MYNRLHTIPACDGRTDRQTDKQTSCHGIVRAMHTRSAVKPKKTLKQRLTWSTFVADELAHVARVVARTETSEAVVGGSGLT